MVQMDAIQALRYGYLGAASGVILIATLSPLRNRFLAYGARSSQEPPQRAKDSKLQDGKGKNNNVTASNSISSLLDTVASLTVPHDWFLSFYFLSLSLCAFWPGEILGLQGPAWRFISDHTPTTGSGMTFSQLQTTWAMMLIQSGRRLYECLTLPSSSESQMFVGHWVTGIAFYAATSVAVWIEGAQTLQTHTLSTDDFFLISPSFRTLLSVLLFLLASGFQYDVHTYLADLKTKPPTKAPSTSNTSPTTTATTPSPPSAKSYKLPSHPAFTALICPHYTAEILIYLALALNAAPKGAWVNGTLLCAVVFVGVNLGVTAHGTREWYVKVFGEESVRGRWRMVPFVY